MKVEIDSSEIVHVSHQLSTFAQLKAELIQVRSEKSQLIENKIELSNKLNLTKKEFQNFKTDSQQEISRLKKDLEAKNSQLVELEHIFEVVKRENSSLANNSNRLELELSAMKQKCDDDLKASEKTGTTIYSLTNLNRSKSATISQLRLSEERYEAEVRKLTVALKTKEESDDKSNILFESIKRSLKKVFREDEKLCQNLPCDDFETLDDPELCEIVKFMLEDFVTTRRRHLNDIYRTQVKLNVQTETIVRQAAQIRSLIAGLNKSKASTTAMTIEQARLREKKDLEENFSSKRIVKVSHVKPAKNNATQIRSHKLETKKPNANDDDNKKIRSYITNRNELKGQVKVVTNPISKLQTKDGHYRPQRKLGHNQKHSKN